MNIYTSQTFYNDELAEIMVLTNVNNNEQKFLLCIKVPIRGTLVDMKLPIKSSSLEEAFNNIDKTIQEFEKNMIEAQNKAKLVVPPTNNPTLRLSV